MVSLFADTSYFHAVFDPGDQWHAQASRWSDAASSRQIVTSELVLIEFLNTMAGSGKNARLSAIDIADGLYAAPGMRIVPASTAQLQSAMLFYKKHADKQWSLVDCASFLIMRAHKIEAALTADKHFLQAGFRALLRE